MRYNAVLLILALMQTVGGAATNNSGNAPCFLWIEVSSNGFGALPNNTESGDQWDPVELDIGIDIGADGTVDYWASQDPRLWLAEGNSNGDGASLSGQDIDYNRWRRFVIPLDQYTGQMAKIRLVDQTNTAYLAVNAIRLNMADGNVVANGVPNGDFEDETPLNHWTLLSGTVENAASLLKEDTQGDYLFYENRFFSTRVNGNQDTAVVESEAFLLQPVSSFVLGIVQGGGSEMWLKKEIWENDVLTDNGTGVYIDIGTETQDPNGQFDLGTDIPLLGHFNDPDNLMYTSFFNTSGLEGKRAQIAVVDQSYTHSVAVDGWRMNWDPEAIANGDFEEIPDDWTDSAAILYSDHPAGAIPGWTVKQIAQQNGDPGDATVYYFDRVPSNDHKSGYVWVGTGGTSQSDVAYSGVELRSNSFAIEAIPTAETSVFVQFASAESATKIVSRETADAAAQRTAIQLCVDSNGNRVYFEDADSIYLMQCHALAWNRERINHSDMWHYPEYRWYIRADDRGKNAVIRVEDSTTASYGWLAVDDFFVWNGEQASLAFPNSDFEMGDLTNWEEQDIQVMRTWLSGSQKAKDEGRAVHRALNRTHMMVDGDFAADSADHSTDGGASGDGCLGRLVSQPFALPTLVTATYDWPLY